MPVALSEFHPKFFLANVWFLSINELVIRSAPLTVSCASASKQLLSNTNLPT